MDARIALLLILFACTGAAIAQDACDDGQVKKGQPWNGIPAEWARTHGHDNGLSAEIAKLHSDKRDEEIDGVFERAISRNKNDWAFLWAAAGQVSALDHRGMSVDGKFLRGRYHAKGVWADSEERDQVRALQLLVQAARLADHDPNRDAAAEFYLDFAGCWLRRPQYLTNLETLPEAPPTSGAIETRIPSLPAAPDESSVLFKVPASFEAAANDGERWRWCLQRAVELSPPRKADAEFALASRLYSLDVAGIAGQEYYFLSDPKRVYARYFHALAEQDPPPADNPFLLTTMAGDETIGQTGRGIQRLRLPAELNYIQAMRRIADGGGKFAVLARDRVAESLVARLQFDAATEYLQRNIGEHGDPVNSRQPKLDEIFKNWGAFEEKQFRSTGDGAKLAYRYRNGGKVTLHAAEINVEKVINDKKASLKNISEKRDSNRLDVESLCYELIEKDVPEFLGVKSAEWTVDMQPRADHLDRVTEIAAPLKEPGAYLIKAAMENGNESRAVLWIDGLAIVHKQGGAHPFYFVCDARTGLGVPGAKVEFLGYTMPDFAVTHPGVQRFSTPEIESPTKAEMRLVELTQVSDGEGGVIPAVEAPPEDRNLFWQVTASTADGLAAHLGITKELFPRSAPKPKTALNVYCVTNQSGYETGEPVQFQGWFGRKGFEKSALPEYANRSIRIDVRNSNNATVSSMPDNTDDFGGFSGEFLPDDKIVLNQHHNLHVIADFLSPWWIGFWVHEKRAAPQFSLTIDTPHDPLVLGNPLKTTIHARTLYGAPAAGAHITYRIVNICPIPSWSEAGEWDWLFGRGYGWIGPEHRWYAGWENWGSRNPQPFWSAGHSHEILRGDAVANADGTCRIEFDTSLAKAIGGDSDQRFDIRAEFYDAPGVSAVRCFEAENRPLRVYAQLDRGFYRADEPIKAGIFARRAGGAGASGAGEFTLYRVTYGEVADGKSPKPVETVAQSWKLDVGDDGRAHTQIDPLPPGQYRLGCRITAKDGRAAEGGCLFCVTGPGFDGAACHFNPIELIPDQREHAPGDTAHLLINAERPDSTVLLFVTTADESGRPPKVLHIKGKSAVVDVPIHADDVPNIFADALTVSDGRLFEVYQAIVVPPVAAVAKVELQPSKFKYKPGETATVSLQLRDNHGLPLSGSALLRVSDAARPDGFDASDIRMIFDGSPRCGWLGTLNTLAHTTDQSRVDDNEWQHPPLNLFDRVLLDWFNHTPGAFQGGTIEGHGFRFFGGSSMFNRWSPFPGDGTFTDGWEHSVYWKSGIEIGPDGKVTVDAPLPNRVGTWKILVQAMSVGSRPGQAEVELETRGE